MAGNQKRRKAKKTMEKAITDWEAPWIRMFKQAGFDPDKDHVVLPNDMNFTKEMVPPRFRDRVRISTDETDFRFFKAESS